MQSLAVKYRPKKFEEVCSQTYIVEILKKQLEIKQFPNCLLFAGPSGTGKTTLARIFANELNNNKGQPIEIDAASNNGVDNVRSIVESAKERSLDSDYKVFIIDEVHMITTAGWNAFLKCLEEVPFYTIFIFCTTNPEKIPSTIMNRVMRFNLNKIPLNLIKERLIYICNQENINYTEDSIDYISKLSEGGLRDAIAKLEKCIKYTNDLDIDKVLTCLGNFSYDQMFNLTNSIIDNDLGKIINIIKDIYDEGNDLRLFIDYYTNFVLDLLNYSIFKRIDVTSIPSFLELTNDHRCVKYVVSIESNINYFRQLLSKLLTIKNTIKYDNNIKTTIQIMLMDFANGKVE